VIPTGVKDHLAKGQTSLVRLFFEPESGCVGKDTVEDLMLILDRVDHDMDLWRSHQD
jgi:hypothetical protein